MANETDTLDDSLSKTMEIVSMIQQISQCQEEADRKVHKETRSHQQTKQKIKGAEADHEQARREHDKEVRAHEATRKKMQEAERSHTKVVENLRDQVEDLAATRLHNESLHLEMEAQRKAFAVNVNWAARHADLVNRSDGFTDTLQKSQRELEDVRSQHASAHDQSRIISEKLAELAILEEKAMAAAAQRKRGRSQAMAQLEKSLGNADEGLLAMALSAWHAAAEAERTTKLRKSQGHGQALKAIASQGTALMAMIFAEWLKDTEGALREALKKQKENLEMQNKDSGAGAERARQKALAALNKSFAARDADLIRISFEGWRHVRVARLKADKGKNACLQGIANSDRALQDFCLTAWFQLIEATRGKKEQKDQSMQKALRMVSGSQNALLVAVTSVWGFIAKKSKNRMNKIKMVERNIGASGEALTQAIVAKWGAEARRSKQVAGKKSGNMQRGLRAIADSDQAILASVHGVWGKFAHAEQGKKKSKDRNMGHAVRMIAASNTGLVVTTFGAWSARSRKNGQTNKKLRVLSRLMSHQNTQVLVACFIGWVRCANTESQELKKESEALQAQINESKELVDAADARLEERRQKIASTDKYLIDLQKEVESSRKKARVLGEELGKIGVFLASTPRTPTKPKDSPRTSSRPGSGARHGGGARKISSKDDVALPKIDTPRDVAPQPVARPQSRAGVVSSPAPPARTAWQEEPL